MSDMKERQGGFFCTYLRCAVASFTAHVGHANFLSPYTRSLCDTIMHFGIPYRCQHRPTIPFRLSRPRLCVSGPTRAFVVISVAMRCPPCSSTRTFREKLRASAT